MLDSESTERPKSSRRLPFSWVVRQAAAEPTLPHRLRYRRQSVARVCRRRGDVAIVTVPQLVAMAEPGEHYESWGNRVTKVHLVAEGSSWV